MRAVVGEVGIPPRHRWATADGASDETVIGQSRSWALDLLIGIGDAAFAVNTAGRIVGWNAAAERLFGSKDREARGEVCQELLGCHDLQEHALCTANCPLFQAAALRKPSPAVDFLVRHRSGHLIAVSGSVIILPQNTDAAAIVLLRPSASGVVDSTSGRAAPPLSAPRCAGKHGRTLGMDLATILDRLLIATGGDAAELFLTTPTSERMVLAAHRGCAPRAFRQIVEFDRGRGFPGLVAQSGEPIQSLDLSHDERYLRTEVKRQGFRIYLCVPVWGNSRLLGSLHVAFRQHSAACAVQLPFLTQVAQQLGVILDLHRFNAAELIAAQPLDRSTDAGANLRRLADQTLLGLVDTAEADCGAILLTDSSSDDLQTVSERGVSPRLHRALARACKQSSCPAIVEQRCVLPTEWTDSAPCRVVQRDLGAIMCLPLEIARQACGVVLLGWRHRGALPTRHLTLLHAAIDHTAVALHNAQVALHQEREARATASQKLKYEAVVGLAPDLDARISKEQDRARLDAVAPFLDLRCLGQFTIFRDGRPVPTERFARRRSLTLLKILLTRYDKRIHREELIEMLWPESDPGSANDLLNVVVHYLRRALEPDAPAGQPSRFIRTNGDYYSFDTGAPHRLDSQDFLEAVRLGAQLERRGQHAQAIEACQKAIALYAGDFLDDEPYSDWCAMHREYLRETFLTTARQAARIHFSQSNFEDAITCLRRALLAEPTLEDVHRDLIKALWAAGRRDEALRQYRECRAILERELGVDPLPETEALRRQITS